MSASVEARTINPPTSACSHARSSRAVIARQPDERRTEAGSSAPTFVLEQRVGQLQAGLHLRQRDGDPVAAVVDDGPAAQQQRIFLKTNDHLALLRLFRL